MSTVSQDKLDFRITVEIMIEKFFLDSLFGRTVVFKYNSVACLRGQIKSQKLTYRTFRLIGNRSNRKLFLISV